MGSWPRALPCLAASHFLQTVEGLGCELPEVPSSPQILSFSWVRAHPKAGTAQGPVVTPCEVLACVTTPRRLRCRRLVVAVDSSGHLTDACLQDLLALPLCPSTMVLSDWPSPGRIRTGGCRGGRGSRKESHEGEGAGCLLPGLLAEESLSQP